MFQQWNHAIDKQWKDRFGLKDFFQSKAGEMKPFKPNRSFHCLSKAWLYCSNKCFWNYKLLFGQTTMGQILAFCRKTDYVANMRFLCLAFTDIWIHKWATQVPVLLCLSCSFFYFPGDWIVTLWVGGKTPARQLWRCHRFPGKQIYGR